MEDEIYNDDIVDEGQYENESDKINIVNGYQVLKSRLIMKKYLITFLQEIKIFIFLTSLY